MELKISKRYSSYSSHLLSAKFYEDIGYHGGIQGVIFFIIFFGSRPSFKNFVAL